MKNLIVPYVPHSVGRPRKFKSPSEMEKAFLAYIEDRKNRELEIREDEEGYIGESEKAIAKIKTKTYPLSIDDFCVYLGVSREWWAKLPEEFLQVKERISTYLFNHQLNGALTGEYNANIVARRLGLADKQENEVKVVEFPKNFTKEEAKDFIANLNK